MPGKFEPYKVKGGKCSLRLKSTNAQVVGTIEQYGSERDCETGIQSVAKNAPGAKIEDLSA